MNPSPILSESVAESADWSLRAGWNVAWLWRHVHKGGTMPSARALESSQRRSRTEPDPAVAETAFMDGWRAYVAAGEPDCWSIRLWSESGNLSRS